MILPQFEVNESEPSEFDIVQEGCFHSSNLGLYITTNLPNIKWKTPHLCIFYSCTCYPPTAPAPTRLVVYIVRSTTCSACSLSLSLVTLNITVKAVCVLGTINLF